MNDLTKLASELSNLTVLETDELAAMLSARADAEAGQTGDVVRALAANERASAPSHENLRDLAAEEWLMAETLSLKAEAAALARSLDGTLDYVRARCEAVGKAA